MQKFRELLSYVFIRPVTFWT